MSYHLLFFGVAKHVAVPPMIHGLCTRKIGLSTPSSNNFITDRSMVVPLLWFILIVIFRPLSVCL